MIRFSLVCDSGHESEAWFSKSADFDAQKARGLVACPLCGSTHVDKSLMAPSVTTARTKEKTRALAMNVAQKEKLDQIKAMVASVRESSEDVGERFPEEARRIHYGESEARGIIGKADASEAQALMEEGIAFAPLPHFPDDNN